MADESEKRGADTAATGAFPAAAAIALSHPGPLDPRTAAYLEEQSRLSKHQSRLLELQSQNLVEQNAFELSHLKWRRLTDRALGAPGVSKEAPNWGRLHLKWHDDARKQFASAATLDLSADDRASLGKWMSAHG